MSNGDWDEVPQDIQEKIKKIAEDKFIPAVLGFISTKLEHPIYKVEFHDIPFMGSFLAGVFKRKERYYLCKLSTIAWLPFKRFSKKEAKCMIGCAVKICNIIGQSGLGDEFTDLVRGCFTPDNEPDLNHPYYLFA